MEASKRGEHDSGGIKEDSSKRTGVWREWNDWPVQALPKKQPKPKGRDECSFGKPTILSYLGALAVRLRRFRMFDAR
jgi:hypothetical protein